jgi:hypothetical protein
MSMEWETCYFRAYDDLHLPKKAPSALSAPENSLCSLSFFLRRLFPIVGRDDDDLEASPMEEATNDGKLPFKILIQVDPLRYP